MKFYAIQLIPPAAFVDGPPIYVWPFPRDLSLPQHIRSHFSHYYEVEPYFFNSLACCRFFRQREKDFDEEANSWKIVEIPED